jgi:hypothetical protein
LTPFYQVLQFAFTNFSEHVDPFGCLIICRFYYLGIYNLKTRQMAGKIKPMSQIKRKPSVKCVLFV